jgi:GT2 family glycosyltransferase
LTHNDRASVGSKEENTASLPPVTIVVPIYSDLPTLTSCVESLKQNVDLERNHLLLVNDCGPDADAIEASLLAQIRGCGSIRYERNERNLGFVGTCNRAVSELDTTDNDILLLNSDTVTTPGFLEELSAVLHLSPLHGVVCPRSNDAVIASFPYKLRDPSSGHEIARASQVHAALSGTIRRYSISPVAVGFCFLVRRDLITQHGLFDEAFAPGYCEEYDFCLRMNEFGYSSVIANRAIVFHIGTRSFNIGPTRSALLSAHTRILMQRYPFLTKAIESYMFLDRDPVDAFADALAPADNAIRILVDIDVVPAAGLGSDTTALLAALQEALDPFRLIATISVPDVERDRIAARYPGLQVIHQSRLDGLWDLAVASADMLSRTQLIRLNRVSPRWVFTCTGIGAVRTWRTRAANSSSKALLQDAIGHADGVIALRSGVATELESYAGSGILRLPTDGVIDGCGTGADGIVQEVVERYGRSAIDVERLRARWDYFARVSSYEGYPRSEPLIRRLARRAEYAAPRPVGYAKGVVRKLLRGDRPQLKKGI